MLFFCGIKLSLRWPLPFSAARNGREKWGWPFTSSPAGWEHCGCKLARAGVQICSQWCYQYINRILTHVCMHAFMYVLYVFTYMCVCVDVCEQANGERCHSIHIFEMLSIYKQNSYTHVCNACMHACIHVCIVCLFIYVCVCVDVCEQANGRDATQSTSLRCYQYINRILTHMYVCMHPCM